MNKLKNTIVNTLKQSTKDIKKIMIIIKPKKEKQEILTHITW